MSIYNCFICRYNEIAIKGGNRNMFEKCLAENIQLSIKYSQTASVVRINGRIFVKKKDDSFFNDAEIADMKDKLSKICGLETFSPAVKIGNSMEEIIAEIKKSSPLFFSKLLEKQKTVEFRSRAKRSDKKFPLSSKDIEIQVASLIFDLFGDSVKVNLDEPDISIGIEIREKNTSFIYYESLPCPGGLPTGSNSPVLAFLSGGIDSPVAAYMSMKRGCRTDFITFHSYPYTPEDSVEKVKRLVKVLNTFQRPSRLFICNIAELQKTIRDTCDPRARTILYRRAMFRIGEKLAGKYGLKAIITGECVGQVASQTVINLNTINDAINMIVLRHLTGLDKQEIISIARRIGTYNISKEQVPDSCTVFAPPSPATSMPIYRAQKEENLMTEYNSLIDKILTEIIIYDDSDGTETKVEF